MHSSLTLIRHCRCILSRECTSYSEIKGKWLQGGQSSTAAADPTADPTGRSVSGLGRRAGRMSWHPVTLLRDSSWSWASGAFSCQGQRGSSSQAGLVGAVCVPTLSQLTGTLPGAGDTHRGHIFTPGVRALQCFPHQLPVNYIFPLSPLLPTSVSSSQKCFQQRIFLCFLCTDIWTYFLRSCFHFKLPFKKDLSLPDTVLTLGDC